MKPTCERAVAQTKRMFVSYFSGVIHFLFVVVGVGRSFLFLICTKHSGGKNTNRIVRHDKISQVKTSRLHNMKSSQENIFKARSLKHPPRQNQQDHAHYSLGNEERDQSRDNREIR